MSGSRFAAVGLALLLLAGCGFTDAPAGRAVAADASLADECGSAPSGARRLVVTVRDGARLGAAVVGDPSARHGVVLAHGGSQTLCDWLDIAAAIAQRADALVVVPDRRGVGSSSKVRPDDAAAPDDLVRVATAAGLSSATFLGSSAGAPVALSAALRAPQQACSVALVSPAAVPPARLGALGVPLFTVVEAQTPKYVAVAHDLARLAPAAAAKGRQVEVAGTADHSSGLVNNHPAALDLLVEAVRACG